MHTEKSKRSVSAIVKNLGSLVITAFLLLITFYLTYKSFTETGDMSVAGEMQEQLLFSKDNIFLNIIVTAAATALIFLLLRLTKNIKPTYFTSALLLLTLILGVIWCCVSSTVPTNDSRQVITAAIDASDGIYDSFDKKYLTQYFPYQTGYVFFTEIFARIFSLEYGQFIPLQCLNVVFLCVAYFALLKITDMAFKSDTVHRLTCILLATALSPVFFSTFLYGNIPGLALALLSMWKMLVFLENRKFRHAAAAALTIALAVLIKLNYAIVLAAELIITILNLVSKPKELLKSAAYIALSAAAVFTLQRSVIFIYSERSGAEFGEGIPMISWAAMGLNEGYIEAGWYEQAYTVGNYLESGLNSEKASENSKEVIAVRLKRFVEIPEYAVDFFDRKISSQWNEPTYQSLWTNEVRLRSGSINPVSSFILYDCSDALKAFMNYHGQIIFLGAFAASVTLLRRRNNASTTLMLVILGGFLYHTVFEAKSQYILPYFIILIPLAAYGITALSPLFPENKRDSV